MIFLQAFAETEENSSDLFAISARESAEGLLRNVESMLQGSYNRGESSEEWWTRFSSYYRLLDVDASTRVAFVSRLDWLFCRHGETAWPGVRQTFDTTARDLHPRV